MSEQSDVLELLGSMHLDCLRNGDWEGAARLADEIERRIRPNTPTSPATKET